MKKQLTASVFYLAILTPAFAEGPAPSCLQAQRNAQHLTQQYNAATNRYVTERFGITDPAVLNDGQRLAMALSQKLDFDSSDKPEANYRKICLVVLPMYKASQKELENAVTAWQDVEKACGSAESGGGFQVVLAYSQRLKFANECNSVGAY
jgi:hypothetical protein